MHALNITCPTCFESFEISCGGEAELPADIDYDCEICCRPMRIQCWWDDVAEIPLAQAQSIED